MFRNWAQRLDPIFKMPPIRYTINRVHPIQVQYATVDLFVPDAVILKILWTKLIDDLNLVGAIKYSEQLGPYGEKRYSASMNVMIAGDEKGGVS